MKLIIFSLISLIFTADYYVSNFGSMFNPGTFDSPFLKIQQAADIMEAGDICYIRQGTYHENVTLDNQDGSALSPIVFTSYNNERVVLDGTILINSLWIP